MKETISRAFTFFEDIIYGAIAVLLIAVGFLMIVPAGRAIVDVIHGGGLLEGVISAVDMLLLGLVVTEILHTVVVSLESHSLKAEPFLIVGPIAAVRRVLLISLDATHLTGDYHAKFMDHILEPGVLAVLIVVFVLAILFLRQRGERRPARGQAIAVSGKLKGIYSLP